MSRIMCSQKLWRRLGNSGRPPAEVSAPVLHGAALGSWALKVFRYYRQDLVIALEERTYLTLVFHLAPRAGFRSHFATALVNALHDLGIPPPIAQAESTAAQFAPLARLTNRNLVGALNDLEFMCGIELEYHEDVRKVQRNLNDFPHPNRDPCVPLEAVLELFKDAPSKPSFAAH